MRGVCVADAREEAASRLLSQTWVWRLACHCSFEYEESEGFSFGRGRMARKLVRKVSVDSRGVVQVPTSTST